jgi:phytoene dehydrogenase-like protein
MGGELRVGYRVERVEGRKGNFLIKTRRGYFQATQVVSAIPAASTACIAPLPVAKALQPYLRRDTHAMGGAIVVFLGVPEDEVSHQTFTHHQLLQDYTKPLGYGNNMFISVPGDLKSAPAGHRALMISTHCPLEDWEGLPPDLYHAHKQTVGEQLVSLARRVYPTLGHNAIVYEIGTPRTYERFTHRPRGGVGGVHLTIANSNQHALPHDIGVAGFWLAGDTTWPGLGTVACILGSRIVAEGVARSAYMHRRCVFSLLARGMFHERAAYSS